MSSDYTDQRPALDQLAAGLRDMRRHAKDRPDTAAEDIRSAADAALAEHPLSGISADTLADMASLATDSGFDDTIVVLAATITAHLPHIRPEDIGAVVLDLSRVMLSYRADPDPEAAQNLRDLPMLLAFAGQHLYTGGPE